VSNLNRENQHDRISGHQMVQCVEEFYTIRPGPSAASIGLVKAARRADDGPNANHQSSLLSFAATVSYCVLKAGNRNAAHPINAILNYAYAMLESQVRIKGVAEGYDPTPKGRKLTGQIVCYLNRTYCVLATPSLKTGGNGHRPMLNNCLDSVETCSEYKNDARGLRAALRWRQ
jgi:hypothetical protein